MELYKRFSFQAFAIHLNQSKSNTDDVISEHLNQMITEWAKDMEKKHKNFTYRIINADTNFNPHWKPMGSSADNRSVLTVIHVLYRIEE